MLVPETIAGQREQELGVPVKFLDRFIVLFLKTPVPRFTVFLSAFTSSLQMKSQETFSCYKLHVKL